MVWAAEVSGDLAVFAGLARHYVGYLSADATGSAGYYLVQIGVDGIAVSRLD